MFVVTDPGLSQSAWRKRFSNRHFLEPFPRLPTRGLATRFLGCAGARLYDRIGRIVLKNSDFRVGHFWRGRWGRSRNFGWGFRLGKPMATGEPRSVAMGSINADRGTRVAKVVFQ